MLSIMNEIDLCLSPSLCVFYGIQNQIFLQHVYAFPMHTYSLFHIFDDAWDFSNCSSLLLPLNLFTLVVSMAPKRKSTLARNLLRSGASSSTDPSPSNVRFRDDDAFKAFSENFSRRGIHPKHQVILSDFADTDLPSVIHSRGWESLCDVPINTHRINRSDLSFSLAFEVRTFLSHHNWLRMCFVSLG